MNPDRGVLIKPAKRNRERIVIKRIEPGRLAVWLTGRRPAAFMGMVFLAAVTGFVAMLPWGGAPVLAQEAISQEEPTPSSVDEVVTSMQRSFQEKPSRPEFFPRLKEQLKDTPPFLRDTKLNVALRTYYFYHDKHDDSKSEAWTLGGALSYRSGWFLDRLSLGAALYTSQPLYAPDNRDGTQLLKPGQEGYTVLGRVYGRLKLFEENFVSRK